MKPAKKILVEALVILAVSLAFALGVNIGLVKKYARGEFRTGYLSAPEMPGVVMIGLDEAEDIFRQGDAVFIDSRDSRQFAAGHVPGARRLTVAEAEAESLKPGKIGIPADKKIVVYCEGGDCRASLFLAGLLRDEGFRSVRVFAGGWEEWRQAGLPAEQGDDQE